METGKLIKWIKKEGDRVNGGDILAEVETDKADVEMEAFGSGVLRKILVKESDTVPVGSLIAVIAEPSDDIRRDYLELVELELVELPSIAPPPAAVGVALHWLERLQQAPSLPGSRAAQVRSRNSRTTLPRASLDDDRSYTS